MANDFYNASGAPATSANLTSATMRSEFTAIDDAFDKLPTMTANGDGCIFVNSAGTALVAKTAAQARTLLGLVIGTDVQAAGVPCVNWLLNPDGEVAQSLPASSADGDYDFDQWIALTQTGAVASTQTSNPEDGYRYGMRMTQSQASAQRMGRIQIIEGKDAIKLRGKTVTYGGRRRLSSSANIRMAIVEWTGTEDSAVKDVVNDWTSSTYTTGNFFKSTTTTVVATAQVAMTANTARDCSVSGTISSSATNILVFEWTESTVAQNVTFDAWGSRLIEASSLIDYIRRLYAEEEARCLRFFEVMKAIRYDFYAAGTGSDMNVAVPMKVRKRSDSVTVTPTTVTTNWTGVTYAASNADFVNVGSTGTAAGDTNYGWASCSVSARIGA